MAWKTGPNTQLGLANANPAIPDSVIGGMTSVTTGYVATQLGAVATYYEDTQGPGELIYLPGVNGLVAGDLVNIDLLPGAQAVNRHVTVTYKNKGVSLAVAIGAPQAGQYGWFQISGVAVVNAVAGTVAGAVFATATAGSVSSTAIAGEQIQGTRLSSAVGIPAAGKAYLTLNRPSNQTQIT